MFTEPFTTYLPLCAPTFLSNHWASAILACLIFLKLVLQPLYLLFPLSGKLFPTHSPHLHLIGFGFWLKHDILGVWGVCGFPENFKWGL